MSTWIAKTAAAAYNPARMPRLTVEQLVDGMVLEEPIVDPLGRTLLGKGEVLSALYIQRLPRWGISHVVVERREDEADDAAPEGGTAGPNISARLEAMQSALDGVFERHTGNRAMQGLKAIAAKVLRELIAGGST